MRRLFLLAATLILLLQGAQLRAQVNFVRKYSVCENADTVQIRRRAFYSLVGMTGYDKKTRQLLKNLNVGKVVYLNMLESPESDCQALDDEIRTAVATGQYTALDSAALDEGRVSMLFYADNDHIKQVLVYTPPPKTSLIQIGCYARGAALSTRKTEGEGEGPGNK